MNKSDKMSNNTTNSQITCENLSWSINELYSKYAEISKPKPQRDSNWTILPANSNAPNYKDYITKEIFENMLNKNNESNRKPKSYNGSKINGKKITKRRKLNLFDKIVISNYWNRNIPNKFLKEQYSIEHITPFSSIWENEIDIDRIGNIFPTFNEINIKRGNRDLEIYKSCPLYNSIKPLLPMENYNKINLYDNKKSTIISNELYNQYCLENEKNYISNLISELYE